MLGDFNAAPTYATYEFIVALPYYNNKTYNGNNWHWLITNEDDTNVASTQKPYDRYTFCLILLHFITRKSPTQR